MERRKQLTVAWVPTFSENYIPQHVFVGGHDSTSHEQLFIGRLHVFLSLFGALVIMNHRQLLYCLIVIMNYSVFFFVIFL